MPTSSNYLKSFVKDDEGAAAVVVALTLTVILTFVAFGVDLAMMYRERARLQAEADLTALGTVADLEAADTRLSQMLDGNGLPPEALASIVYGRYLRNPALPRPERFQPLPEGSEGVNAIELRLSGEVPLTFARVLTDGDAVAINGQATATRTGAASFSLGSRLLGLDPAVLSAALTQLLGVEVSLTARDIAVLGATQLNTADLLQALGDRVGYAPLNPSDVLTLRPRASDLIRAMQSVMPADATTRLAPLTSLPATVDLAVDGVFAADDRDLGLTLTGFLSEVEVGALDLLSAMADSVDATADLPVAINVAVPGVLSTRARLRFQDRPERSGWIAIGEEGTTLHSAAARLSAEVEIAPDTIGDLGAGVTATRLRLPLHAELAGATATLTDLSCSATDTFDPVARFSTAFRPLSPTDGVSVAALYLGELDTATWNGNAPIALEDLDFADVLDLSIAVDLLLFDLDVDLLTLQVRSVATVGQSQVQEIAFTGADIASGDVTRRFGAGELLGTATASLLSPETTQFRVKPGHDGLVAGAVAPVVNTVLALLPERFLSTLATPLDAVLDETLAAAGLRLGEGELTLTGHHCETVQLVR